MKVLPLFFVRLLIQRNISQAIWQQR